MPYATLVPRVSLFRAVAVKNKTCGQHLWEDTKIKPQKTTYIHFKEINAHFTTTYRTIVIQHSFTGIMLLLLEQVMPSTRFNPLSISPKLFQSIDPIENNSMAMQKRRVMQTSPMVGVFVGLFWLCSWKEVFRRIIQQHLFLLSSMVFCSKWEIWTFTYIFIHRNCGELLAASHYLTALCVFICFVTTSMKSMCIH